ncbi:MAG: hypothetical protein IJF73_06725, partial [Clostridia bacterium]|nr:hypothetical protein [Clostridia bacterium]
PLAAVMAATTLVRLLPLGTGLPSLLLRLLLGGALYLLFLLLLQRAVGGKRKKAAPAPLDKAGAIGYNNCVFGRR